MEILEGRKFLVVGAGFYGAVWAHQLASVLGEKVLVIDQRNHIGGNSYTYNDTQTGIEVHKYGSHIFHTQDKNIWDFINKFTQFNNYRHRVFTSYQEKIYSMPINLETINSYYKKNFSPSEAKIFMAQEIAKEKILKPKNLEEKAISQIGRFLYDAFIKGYTEKQWGQKPTVLPESIINRLPVRYNYNAFYFDDPYQGIPLEGYTTIFKKMLDSPLIEVKLRIDFQQIKNQIPQDTWVIYSGPIDAYFDYSEGELGWRTLDFQQEILDLDDFQGNSVMNYADSAVPFTRIHEFKHYHPEIKQQNHQTFIMREYSRQAKKNDVPYYPVNTAEDKIILGKYQEKAQELKNIIFGGRLGSYKYFDMHQVIAQALIHFSNWSSSH